MERIKLLSNLITRYMATVVLKYSDKNSLAMSLLNSIKLAGVFEVFEKSDNYNPEFVKKIEKSEAQFKAGKYKKIETADLWK